jgi:hypothetical protein
MVLSPPQESTNGVTAIVTKPGQPSLQSDALREQIEPLVRGRETGAQRE